MILAEETRFACQSDGTARRSVTRNLACPCSKRLKGQEQIGPPLCRLITSRVTVLA